MNHFKRSALALAALAALLLLAVAAFAAPTLVPKVDNFILFQDYSGSMAMDFQGGPGSKVVLSKSLLSAMNGKIPPLKYQGGLYTFAPFGKFLGVSPYDRNALAAAIGGIKTDYDIYGRQTPMGDGLAALDPVIGATTGKTAVILFSDGENNLGTDPVAEARALYGKYGNRLCIHVVSFADTAHGKRVLDEIRALSRCTVFADAAALRNPAVMDQFVKDVFFETAAEKAVAAEKEVIVFRNLNFAFDKYEITSEMIPSLEQALMILKQRPELEIMVEGHTDSIGTEVYNQGLSERRAKSVVDWLVKNGVDSQRIESVGYGEIRPKYDNSTAEGRFLNRRVEIHSK